MKKNKDYRLTQDLRSNSEIEYVKNLANFLKKSKFSDVEKVENFPIFTSRQTLAQFLFKYEIFKQILNVNGSIIECGVAFGSGIFTFAHLSTIFEPANHTRKIFGFDTFSGFPSISKFDTGQDRELKKGGMRVDSYKELLDAIKIFDQNRPTAHITKLNLVKGDFKKTSKDFIKKNPHLIVSLLYLDFDLYEPTKIALKTFLPRMPIGSIIAFDEINHKEWPGETIAVLEECGIKNLEIKRYEFDSVRSYAIIK
tara:strand:- start:19415 stop:20176 length:762 start_codon:yes stop_codon:yes gene_type:complete